MKKKLKTIGKLVRWFDGYTVWTLGKFYHQVFVQWHLETVSVHDNVSVERKYDGVRMFRPFLLKYFSIFEREPMKVRGWWRWTNPRWEIWVDIELELASTHTDSCQGDCLLLRFICIHNTTLHYTVTQFEPGPGINPHHRTKTTYENHEGVRPKKKSGIFYNKGWVTLDVKKDKGCNGRRLLPDKKNEINVMIMTHQQTTDELMGLLWYWSPRCLSSLEYKISSAMLSKM